MVCAEGNCNREEKPRKEHRKEDTSIHEKPKVEKLDTTRGTLDLVTPLLIPSQIQRPGQTGDIGGRKVRSKHHHTDYLDLLLVHQRVSECVTQYWFSMYYNLWNIHNLTSHYFSDCSLDQGIFKKANGS